MNPIPSTLKHLAGFFGPGALPRRLPLLSLAMLVLCQAFAPARSFASARSVAPSRFSASARSFTSACSLESSRSFTSGEPIDSTTSRRKALAVLSKIEHLDSSRYWPHVKPALFLENLRANIRRPLAIYQGSNTNFCGYAALSWLPLHDDPMGWLQFMLDLYRDGHASLNGVFFDPSPAVREAAGTLFFKGVLDIRPADQAWFLLLADHFKGYLNIFTPHFHTGSEDTFWAAVNFGKFNRMVRRLFGYRTEARGSDLSRPWIHDLYGYLSHSLQAGGVTFLYVDNTYLYKKNHITLKLHIPTHYLVLTDIRRDGDRVTITYWDYGGKSLRQVDAAFLKTIIFGVVHCTKPEEDTKGNDRKRTD